MEATQQTEPAPHVHKCAARPPIHASGRETPANVDAAGKYVHFFEPDACRCSKPDEPQCCANHPTANPNYVPRQNRALDQEQLQGYAIEVRALKATTADQAEDIADLKGQVARLTEAVTKLGGMRVV